MTPPDPSPATQPSSANPAPHSKTNPVGRLARVIGQIARFSGDPYGLGTGERAALARMNPDAMRAHQVAALSRALIQAEMEPEQWNPETWRRWALIAHGMALAGHDHKGSFGKQLSTANISENRVTKLLTARGGTFRQMVPPLLRLLASKEVSPNWYELGSLILSEGKSDADAQEKAEKTRLKVASGYFSAQAKAAIKS